MLVTCTLRCTCSGIAQIRWFCDCKDVWTGCIYRALAVTECGFTLIIGLPACYLVAADGRLQELNWSKQRHTAWFIDDSVCAGIHYISSALMEFRSGFIPEIFFWKIGVKPSHWIMGLKHLKMPCHAFADRWELLFGNTCRSLVHHSTHIGASAHEGKCFLYQLSLLVIEECRV